VPEIYQDVVAAYTPNVTFEMSPKDVVVRYLSPVISGLGPML
jgi:hypothetical protein